VDIEHFFAGLLLLAILAITWVSVVILAKLFRGQQ